MNKIYVDPTVKLITTNDINVGYNCWLASRKEVVHRNGDKLVVGNEIIDDEEVYKNRINSMSLQYNNLPTYVFEITGSPLFRDILFSINKIGQWATSLRFKNSLYEGFDVRNYPISSEYKGILEWEKQFDKYMDKIQETMITDENRVEMPYSVSSTYWVSINHNTLVGFLSMLKIKMPFFYNIYGKLIIDCINETIGYDIRNSLLTEVPPSIGQYFYNEKSSDFEESFTKLDESVFIKIKMGLLLYSQFIRQTDTCIKGLYSLLEHTIPEKFIHKVFSASTVLNVTYVADYTKFMKTISNRTCWFSMSSHNDVNSWSRFLDLVLSHISVDEFMELLPCNFNKLPELENCKYYDDVKFRGKDGQEKRNLPCAILLNDLSIAEKRNEYDKTNLSRLYLEVVKKLSE